MTNSSQTFMVTLKIISPLAIHARRASEQFAPCLDYVPGSTIRGAFADLYLAGDARRAQESRFRQIFLSEKVLFSDFLPASDQGSDLTRLRPKTAVACKRFSDHERQSLSDTLLWMEIVRETDNPDLLEKFAIWKKCPECNKFEWDGQRDRTGADYYRSIEKPERLEIRKRMITGAAIERSTQTAAHTLLFSHEVIEESGAFDGQEIYLRGTIQMPEELSHTLQDLAQNNRLAVGYGRSRGLGQLQLNGWITPAVERESVRERWDRLNEAAKNLWGQFNQAPKGQYFSLTLRSHLALSDRAGQPLLENLRPADLGLSSEVELCHCAWDAVAVSGWNAVQGLPKADTWALERGSVMLFRLPPDADSRFTIERLEALEKEGCGERRMEGFGRMIACDPFHSKLISHYLKGVR